MHEEPLILIGGGGHCKSCIDVIESAGKWKIIGILEQQESDIGTNVLGYPVIGTNDRIDALIQSGHHFLITVGQVRSAAIRKKLFTLLQSKGASIATVISGKATVSRHAVIGKGSIIHHGAVVNAAAIVGENNIINTGANIEHDAQTGEHTHISTGAILNGNVIVGKECFIGSNSVVVQGVKITDNVVVGAASLVREDLQSSGLYIGAPCKKMEQ